jgi:hypothetical protein
MSEDYVEENILLAGQISNKEPIFKMIAQMDYDNAYMYHFLDLIPQLTDKTKTPIEKMKLLIKLNGQVKFMTGCSELSKLSAIVGDTRKRYSSKGLQDVLRKCRLGTTSTSTSSNP